MAKKTTKKESVKTETTKKETIEKKAEEVKAESAKNEKTQKKNVFAPKYERVHKDAEVPGIGTVRVSMVRVLYSGKEFIAQSKKECVEWVKSEKAKERELKREIAKAARENRKREVEAVYGPRTTARLRRIRENLARLTMRNKMITEEQRVILETACLSIGDVIEMRMAVEK